jgi:hypothetical protein
VPCSHWVWDTRVTPGRLSVGTGDSRADRCGTRLAGCEKIHLPFRNQFRKAPKVRSRSMPVGFGVPIFVTLLESRWLCGALACLLLRSGREDDVERTRSQCVCFPTMPGRLCRECDRRFDNVIEPFSRISGNATSPPGSPHGAQLDVATSSSDRASMLVAITVAQT